MLFCNKCKVTVAGHPNICPLCQGELEGVPESGSVYPRIKKKTDLQTLAIRIGALISIATAAICIAISYELNGSIDGWGLYVVGGLASFWLTFGIAFSRSSNLPKSIMFTTLIVSIIAFLWDYSMGYKGWSLDFFLPIACCVSMLSMAIIGKVLSMHIEQYIYYIILDIVFGIIPFVLLMAGVINFAPPSIACVLTSVISLAGLFLFNGKAMREEIKRRTHV